MSKKELERLLEARTKALKEAQDKAEELNQLVQNNLPLILNENRILRNIIKQIGLIAESNTYGNDKVALRKIKEVSSTAKSN